MYSLCYSWAEKKNRTMTDKLLRRLKEKPHYCVAFGLERGEGKIPSSPGRNKQEFGEALAPYVFSPHSKYGEWDLEHQGRAVVTRIDA